MRKRRIGKSGEWIADWLKHLSYKSGVKTSDVQSEILMAISAKSACFQVCVLPYFLLYLFWLHLQSCYSTWLGNCPVEQ